MYTSILLVAVLVAPRLAIPDRPEWAADYARALDMGMKQGKPVAIFVGTGSQGQASAVKEGQFNEDQLRLLAQKYVCLYVDRSVPGNQRLVRDLGVTVAGVVISDKTGDYQAFHHDGGLAQVELTKSLQQYSDPNLVVARTVSNVNTRLSYYSGSPAMQQFSQPSRTINC